MTNKTEVGLIQINNSFSGAHYLPYAVGLMEGYVKAHSKTPDEFAFLPAVYRRSRIDDVVEVLVDTDIVGVSLYSWNEQLSLAIASKLKSVDPPDSVNTQSH